MSSDLSTGHIDYRPDVDGLRAIAVSLVILVHAFPSVMPNGYIGVDIFFVISGFLITGILVGELRAGRFSLRRFYIRRINRIFPALIVVLAACVGFGALSLYASEFKLLGRSTAWSAAFAANINFYLEVGYWDVSARLKPLLHLWSLGVEEQFYLLWPIMLAAAWYLRLNLVIVLAAVIAVSLGWNLYSITVDQAAAFYLPFSRFWELLVGGALATLGFVLSRRPRLQSALSLTGLALIAAALIERYPESEFPGVHAVLPVVGSAALIAAGSSAWVNTRMLAHPLMVYVGLISYPLYLWHWPILTFARILDGGAPSTITNLLAVSLTGILAAGTYHFVERPLRFGALNRTINAVLLLLVMCVCGGTGYWIYLRDGLPSRYETASLPSADNSATLFQKINRIAFLGDSQAGMYALGIAAPFGKVLNFSTAGWPAIEGVDFRPGTFKGGPPGTPTVTEAALKTILSDTTIDIVVIAHMGVLYLDGDALQSFPNAVAGETSAAAYEAGLRRTVITLTKAGKRVIYIRSIPFFGNIADISACTSVVLAIPRRQRGDCTAQLKDILAIRERHEPYIRGALAGLPNVWVFDPLPFVCDERLCYVERDGVVLYHNTSHLTLRATQAVDAALLRFIDQNVAAGRAP